MADLTQARAKAYFNYDPNTGLLSYIERPEREFASNMTYARHKRRVGKIAGCMNHDGYVKVHIDGIYYSAHRIAWLIMTGELVKYPDFEIADREPTEHAIQNRVRKIEALQAASQ